MVELASDGDIPPSAPSGATSAPPSGGAGTPVPHLEVTELDLGGDVVFITDDTGRIVEVNDAFVQITGYPRREAIGATPQLLSSGYQDPAFYRELWATLRRGEVWEGELVDRRRDGALRTHHATISPVHDASGRITHFVAVERDVTDDLARHGAVGSTGLLHTDLTGRCVYVDPRAAELLGRPVRELLGAGLLRRLATGDAGELRDVVGMAVDSGREHRLDVRTVDDGWLHLTVAPLSVPSGAVIGAVCGVEDVADRVEANRAVEQHEVLLASVLDAIEDPLALIDTAGRVLQVNAAWEAAHSREPGDPVLAVEPDGQLLQRLAEAEDGDLAALADELDQVLRGLETPPRRDGRYRVTPLRAEVGGAIIRRTR